MDKILIVDDTPAVLQALSLVLEIHGYDVITCSSPDDAVNLVNQLRIGLVIQDMNFTKDTTSGEEGMELFYQLRELNEHLPIILITAWTDLEQAVELVKAGAVDYIAKPWDDQKLVNTVANLLTLSKTKQASSKLARQEKEFDKTKKQAQDLDLIYQSASMQRTVDMALQVARSDVSVLISGPNGAGKEKIAELIHYSSPLRDKPFIKVNCGALPENLIEAELFGADAGAYTGANKSRIGRFEAADGGTLFLDEIGNLSHEGQTKLLRVLQTGEFERLGSVKTQKVNVRLISATNADLRNDIAQGCFREDLFYRLNVIEVPLAPLVKRIDDIMPLAKHFLAKRQFSYDAEQKLVSYSWPGNVRELENACKRVAVLSPEGILTAQDFEFLASPQNLKQDINEPDKAMLEKALTDNHGVIAKVARQFGMSRQALYRRLAKYEIEY